MTEQLKEIGQRLMALRDVCELTTAQAAEKLEISEEEYRAYENGELDFSFSFLYNAAGLFGVDVLDILSGESPKLSMCSVVKAGKGFSVTRNKDYNYKHLALTFRGKKAEPLLVTVDPSEKEPHLNSHEGQEFNYLLSGELRFFLGDTTYDLSAGDSVYFDSSLPHAMQVLGDKPAQFLAIVLK